MTVNGVDHINIRTADLDRCKAFYCGVLGLEEGYRPPFDSPALGSMPGMRRLSISVPDPAK